MIFMRYRVSSFTTLVAIICLVLLVMSLYELRWLQREHFQFHHDQENLLLTQLPYNDDKSPIFVPYGRNVDSGNLKHIFNTFNHFGYIRNDLSKTDDWDVLWAHDYPFVKLRAEMRKLKPYQKVNHFPGSGYITNKIDLSTSDLQFIPRAFKIPKDIGLLLDYAKKNPQKMFVQKLNNHRGIKIEKIEKLDLKQNKSFVQVFVDNPLLVDGHKFDIGVYTMITSIDPLTVYIYNGDILFRYCPEKYYPFDPKIVDKYVIGDDYLPTWEVPSLMNYFKESGYNMRDSFIAYMRKKGRNPEKIWSQLEEAIRSVCLSKESAISKMLSSFPSKNNFFEMIRFDFVVDDDLNVYIMEANMSPNLSSEHFPPNRFLYEQVLFSLFSLVGIATHTRKRSFSRTDDLEISDYNILVYKSECSNKPNMCAGCIPSECQLCRHCLTKSKNSFDILKKAYNEHVRRRDCKRVFPPTFVFEKVNNTNVPDNLTPENKFLFSWFKAKCEADKSWC